MLLEYDQPQLKLVTGFDGLLQNEKLGTNVQKMGAAAMDVKIPHMANSTCEALCIEPSVPPGSSTILPGSSREEPTYFKQDSQLDDLV